jgi:hypothetical protein
MQITKCQNRFEVVAEMVEPQDADTLMAEFANWLEKKTLPTDEDYLAALGPCGK